MKKTIFLLLFVLNISIAIAQESQDTIRVMTYNILQYKGTSRNNYLKTVVSSVDPDVILVQEMFSQGVSSFLTNVLNESYLTIEFHDGPDMDCHIYYKEDKLVFIKADYLDTDLRDIAEYEMRIKSNDETVFIYSMHLKASSGWDNEQKRLAETTVLRDQLNRHQEGTNFILAGDFNIYRSTEPAYQKLVQEEGSPSGQSFDPIDTPGDWHSNSKFTSVHTQSPRDVQLGDGGANGGLDDRFDFILISNPLWDNVLVSSYTIYGNDGQHFNISINAPPTNSAVGQSMADALYYATDHLPVFCDFVFDVATGLETTATTMPHVPVLYQNYPNPFNPSTNISFYMPHTDNATLIVYDILGKKVRTLINRSVSGGVHEVEFDAENLPGGVYFYRLQTGEYMHTRKFILLR